MARRQRPPAGLGTAPDRHFAVERPELAHANNRKVQELVARGIVAPAIARTYPIEDYVAAMNDAFSGKSAGRVVLTMDA